MKKILVTGASGFIGSHVVDELHKRDYEVSFFDRSWPHGLGKPDAVFIGDIRDSGSVDEAIRNSDGVINLAGLLGTAEAVDDPMPAAETNIFGGLNFLKALRKYDKPGVQIAVGNHFENNTYSITKTTIERFALMYAKEHNTRVVVVRGLNVYGPRQHHKPIRKITPNFITRALRAEPIKVYGDGEQIMDMIYCEDIARVLVSALEYADIAKTRLTKVVEAGTGRRTTVNFIAELVNKEAALLTGNTQPPLEHVPMRPGESVGAVVVGDPSTLEVIGINSRHFTKLEDGLKTTVKWYFENYPWQHD